MTQPPDEFSEEELDYIGELYERYPQPYPEYRRLWYTEKMNPEIITVDFIEQFLIWNSEYVSRREAIIREWPRKIRKGAILVLCNKAIQENPDQLMCTAKSFFGWLKRNHYIFDQRKHWLNDFSKHEE
jgi:hypothetical protein